MEAVLPSIASLFSSPAILEVMSLVLTQHSRDFFQNEIAKKSQFRLLQVQRALQKLVAAGIVTRSSRGKRPVYSANQSHPMFSEFRMIGLKSFGLSDHLKSIILPLLSQVDLAFVFGSIAQGTENASSDIDLCVVGSVNLMDLAQCLEPASLFLEREINPVLFTSCEFREKVKAKNRFIQDLVSSQKIWLVGCNDEFESIIEGGQASTP